MTHELKSTSDYGFAAWLQRQKQMSHKSAKRVRRGKMVYFYECDEDRWVELRLEYAQSDFQQFLYDIKNLQDPSF